MNKKLIKDALKRCRKDRRREYGANITTKTKRETDKEWFDATGECNHIHYLQNMCRCKFAKLKAKELERQLEAECAKIKNQEPLSINEKD